MAGLEKAADNNEIKSSENQTVPEQWNSVSLLSDDAKTAKSQSGGDKASKPAANSSETTLDFGSPADLYGAVKSLDLKSIFGRGDDKGDSKEEDTPCDVGGDKNKQSGGKSGGADQKGGDSDKKSGDNNKEIGGPKESEKAVDPKVQDLANEQQLEVEAVTRDGQTQYEFSTTIDGKKEVVFQTEQTNLEVIEQQLQQAQNDKVAELEKKYNVDIATDGETTKSADEERDLQVSTPTLGELAAVEQALVHSQPDTKTVDGKPLRIVVGDKSWNEFEGGGIRREDEVVFGHSDDLSQIKEIGVHELAHVGQAQREAKEGYGSYANELGWVKNPNGDDWLLRGKDGSYWQNIGHEGDDPDRWMRVDANGNPADSQGNRTDNPLNPFDHGENSPNTQIISQEEMIGRAAVKPYDDPSSDEVAAYFGNPHEMGAALITPFRNSREDREKLYQNSPDSYQVAKNLDQDQINSAYGTQANGEAKFIRNPEGIVVENTPENALEVQEFETGLRK